MQDTLIKKGQVIGSWMQGILLYIGTVLIELFFGLPRLIFFTVLSYILVFGVSFILVLSNFGFSLERILSHSQVPMPIGVGTTIASLLALFLAYFPVISSVFSFWFTDAGDEGIAWTLGARPSSKREQERIENIQLKLGDLGHLSTKVHSDWWVIDTPELNAYTIGTSMYITSGALRSPHLPAIYVRELAKLGIGDGLFLKALRSFTYPFIKHRITKQSGLSRASEEAGRVSIIRGMMFGGLGVMILGRHWAYWFRERDFLADQKVLELGMGSELLQYLEEGKEFDIAVPYSASWVQYTELRIDKLLQSPAFETSYAHFPS